MTEIPIFDGVVTQVTEWIFTDQSVMIVVAVFAVVIGLSLYGARRMEDN